MVKKLSRIGNSLGVIWDRPVLELLQIDENTPLEITTDGDVLMLEATRRAAFARRPPRWSRPTQRRSPN
jgi:antitoxin MazE